MMTIDFRKVNDAALSALPTILARWLPGGRREGAEYVAKNPTRADQTVGSFKINVRTGRWSDFATGDAGGDPVSLAAYLSDHSKKIRELLDVKAVVSAHLHETDGFDFFVSFPQNHVFKL